MTCIKMGSDESHFNVTLIVRDKVTRPCPQTTTAVEEKGEPKRYRTKVLPRSFRLPAYRLTARPNRLSGPHTTPELREYNHHGCLSFKNQVSIDHKSLVFGNSSTKVREIIYAMRTQGLCCMGFLPCNVQACNLHLQV